ncbi:hypothetical protein AB4Z54_71220, partial [Streptomyces sp. MCAF7]
MPRGAAAALAGWCPAADVPATADRLTDVGGALVPLRTPRGVDPPTLLGGAGAVLRIGSNVISFARLAAFGLTHAALAAVVWQGTTALARMGGVALVAAVALFVVGNALAFALEALVAGVQALRLE